MCGHMCLSHAVWQQPNVARLAPTVRGGDHVHGDSASVPIVYFNDTDLVNDIGHWRHQAEQVFDNKGVVAEM